MTGRTDSELTTVCGKRLSTLIASKATTHSLQGTHCGPLLDSCKINREVTQLQSLSWKVSEVDPSSCESRPYENEIVQFYSLSLCNSCQHLGCRRWGSQNPKTIRILVDLSHESRETVYLAAGWSDQVKIQSSYQIFEKKSDQDLTRSLFDHALTCSKKKIRKIRPDFFDHSCSRIVTVLM